MHFEGESGELDAKLLRGKDGEEEYQLIKVEGGELPYTGYLVDEEPKYVLTSCYL